MHHRRRPALVLAALAAVAGAIPLAAAQPAAGRPVPVEAQLRAPTPATFEIVRGDATASAHVEGRASAIVACAQRGRATFVRARASLRWDARGRLRAVGVRGGSAAFNRCAAKALRGTLTLAAPRRGTGQVALIVRPGAFPPPSPPSRPSPAPAPAPPVTGSVDLQRCTVDSDCTLHFQTSACVPGDPVAVNTLDPAAVRATYPVRRLACGMGGPQYDRLRESTEGRWSAACERARCVVRDAGPQPSLRDRL